MPKPYLKALIVLGLASAAAAQTFQQPAETLPGFKSENVLEARGIDNVNPFSGDPGVVLPLGPEYTLSAAFKWRLTAYYSVKFWNFPDPCPWDLTGGTKFAYVQGDPTLGAGWTLQLGYVVPTPFSQAGGWTYFGPDGGRHAVNLDSQTGVGVTQDGSHLRITAVGFPATTSYTVEFPDGTKEYFEHPFSPPASTVDLSIPGINALYGKDFNNLTAYHETASKRYGLSRVEDRFSNKVLMVAYAGDPGQPTGDPSQPTSVILNPDANGNGPTVSLHWTRTTGTDVKWWVIDSLLFPAFGSLKRQVSFSYLLNSFTRNQYDTSHTLNGSSVCYADALPPTVPDGPLLQTVTFSDSNTASPSFPSFQYSFAYAVYPGTGELTKITLPTGGTIQYSYGSTAGVICDFFGTSGCNPEGSLTSSSTVSAGIGSHPLFQYLDNSLAVGRRIEYDPIANRTAETDYSRQMLVPCTNSMCVDFDDSRLYRRVTVTGPGNDLEGPSQFVTRSYYKVAPPGQTSYFSGVEVDRRYYAGSSDTTSPVRTLIRCYIHDAPAPVCGYRAANGSLQQYSTIDIEPPRAEVTWYGAVPSGSDGGACSGATPCTASANSNYIFTPGTPSVPIGQYGTNQLSSTVPGTPQNWSRTTTTAWSPTGVNETTYPKWMLEIVTSRQTQESPAAAPTAETTNYSVNLANGFLNSSSVSDTAYGGRQDEFTAHDSRWNATTEIQDILPSSSGMKAGAFTDTRIFQDGIRRMGGLLRSVQRSGVSWKSFDVDRDDNTGLITFSRDPNPSLVTGYTYDALGRLTKITPPTPDVPTSISYVSPTETLVTRTSSDGNTWQRYLYDGLGRLRREIRKMPGTGGNAYSVRFHDYDTAGHASFLSEWQLCGNGQAGGNCEVTTPVGTTSSNFDPFGRPQKITKADGNYTTIDYSDGTVAVSETKKKVTTCINASNAVTQQNPTGACSGIGAATTDQYDALGRLTTVTEANGLSTTYTYSVLDKLATVAQGSQSRTFAYDATGLLRSETTPEKGTATYLLYDALGNLTKSREPNGVNLTRVYSAAGRLNTLSSDEAGLPTYLTNTWNDATPGSSLGRLTSRQSKTVTSKGSVTATETMTYAASTGRLASRQFDFSPGATGLVTSWAYNKLGLLDAMTNSAGGQEKGKVKYTYDSASGFSTGVTGEPAPAVSTTLASNGFYAAYGGFASFTLGNTATVQITPDILPRPQRITVGTWDSGTYTYDGAGNVLQTGTNATYAYDALSRISRATIAGQPVQNFAYDQYGNLASKGTQSFTVDTARNRICDPFFANPTCTYPAGSIVAYDALGNLTRWGSTTQQYFYDTLSRQTDYSNGSTQESYLYDGAGERVARSGGFPSQQTLVILTQNTFAMCPQSTPTLTVSFQASGGTPFAPPHSAYNWSISGNPSWVTIDSSGVLTATPPAGTNADFAFQVTATDSQGVSASSNITLKIGACPPYWIAQPADAIVCPGDLFDQSIRARDPAAPIGGADNVTYQWERLGPDDHWMPVSSVPGFPWELREYPPGTVNYYHAIACLATNSQVCVTSRVATVRVSATIEITSLNPGSTICPGQGQNLNNFITALGGNLTIGWQQQNSDGTWTDLTSGQVSPTQTTVYRAKLTSTCVAQPVYSSSITISVQPNPVLTQVPPSQNVCAGSSVTLTATANTQGYFTWQHWNGSSWVQDRTTVNLASSDTYTTTPTATTTCRVTFSAYCGVVSSNFTLTRVTTPTVTNMPAGGDVCPPIALAHNPTVTGATSLLWQQSLNGGAWTNISGATSNSYTSPSLTTPGTYGYRIAATNSCGTTYGTTYWTVNAIPSASITGSACSVPAGQPSTLTCATDTPSPRFLWSPGGQTTQSITVSPTTTTTYTCVVTSIKNCTKSASYTVTVGAQVNAPVITTNPLSQTICSGSSGATLSGSASGTNVLYQWQKQNTDSSWSNVSGATSSTYTALASNATYRLAASNACGTVYSSAATVTVDTTKIVAAITAQPQSTEYCAGSSATLSVTATGTSLSYLWESSVDRSFWSVVGNAATVAVSPTSATYYRVTVSNSCNSVVSNVVTVTRATPVIITTQPVGGTFCPPSHQLYVTATGGSLTYQWQVWNGSAWVNVSGATTNAYSVTATGLYRVVVADVCGSVTSSSASVSFGAAPGQPTIGGDTFIYPGQSAHIYVSNQRFDWNAAFWSDGGTGFDRYVSPAVTTTYQVYVTGASYPCPSPWSPPFTVTVSGTSSALYGGYQSGNTPGSQTPPQLASATPAGTIILAQASPDMHSNKFLSVVRAQSDRILAGDWDGDGVSSLGFYDGKKGQFELWDGDPKGQADYRFVFGPAGSWQPITGDWDGDGIDTVGLFDPQTGRVWLRNANSDGASDLTYALQLPFQNGFAVTGDWTGKGYDTLGVYDPNESVFYLFDSHKPGKPDHAIAFGQPGSGALPLAGDWAAQGLSSIGLYDPASGNVYLRQTLTNGPPEFAQSFAPGLDQVFAGRWDAQKHAPGPHARKAVQSRAESFSSIDSKPESPKKVSASVWPPQGWLGRTHWGGADSDETVDNFAFAAMSRPASRAATSTWFYTIRDESNRPSIEYHVDQAGNVITDRIYAYLGNTLVATYEADNNPPGWVYYGTDHLGSIRYIMSGGNCTQTFQPFGELAGPGCAEGGSLEFAGMERDATSGNDYDHARFDSSAAGRFLAVDEASGKREDPQTWNRYAYTANNPLRYVDPNGRERMEILQAVDAKEFFEHRITKQEYMERQYARGVGALGGAALLAGGAALLPDVAAGGAAAAEASDLGAASLPALATRLGRAGEAFFGIVEGAKRTIESVTGAAFRRPDFLDSKMLLEVKNVTRLGFSKQIFDFLHFAEANGVKFVLAVDKGARISSTLQQLVDQGRIILLRVAIR